MNLLQEKNLQVNPKLPTLPKAIICLAIVACAVGGVFYYQYSKNYEKMKAIVNVETIYPHISISEVDVGGLTIDQANNLLRDTLQKPLEEKTLIFQYNNKQWQNHLKDFNAKINYQLLVEQAYSYAKDGTMKERYNKIVELENNPLNFESEYGFDESLINESLLKIAKEVDKQEKNASYKRVNGVFEIADSSTGLKLNIDSTELKVLELVKKRNGGTVDLVVDTVNPKFPKAIFDNATSLIGTFYTNFSGGIGGRNINLLVASQKINGITVYPDEVFSTNDAFGPQTYENGYRDAPVIVNGKLEDGIGGGVCQVSTTLYNAILFSELQIVERVNHSLAVGYVPLGRDATLAGDYIDFKFKNNTKTPLYIESTMQGNKLQVNIYGNQTHSQNRRLEFESVVESIVAPPREIVTKDPNLNEGVRKVITPSKQGHIVKVYKNVYEGNTFVEKILVNKSVYKARAAQVVVGTKKVEKQPAIIQHVTPISNKNDTPVDNNGTSTENIAPTTPQTDPIVEPVITTEEPVLQDNTQENPPLVID